MDNAIGMPQLPQLLPRPLLLLRPLIWIRTSFIALSYCVFGVELTLRPLLFSIYIPIYDGLRTALYAPQILSILNGLEVQITALHTTIATLTTQITVDQQTLITSQTIHVSALLGSNSALLVPQSGSTPISWSLSCTSKEFTATYTNSDGSILSPTFYVASNGHNIQATGNYAASLSQDPTIGGVISFSFVPTN